MQEELNPFDPSNDFFGDLKEYKPEVTKDDSDFKPFKGKYVCRIVKLYHNVGVSTNTNEPYDFYVLDLQVSEIIDGDKALNRYLRKRYNNQPDNLKKLINDMFTAGIELDRSSREAFDLSLTNAIDKTVNIRAWVWKPEKDRQGNIVPEDEREERQQFNIVKEFKAKGKKSSESAPF